MTGAEIPSPASDAWVQRVIEQPGRPGKLDIEGYGTTFLEWGDPANRRVVVLLHGFLGHSHWWDFEAPWLADRYRVLAMDLAGMGDSDHRDHYSIASFTSQVGAFLQALPVPVTLIGHSFGGHITLRAAHRYPERIARCIIVDSSLGSRRRAPLPQSARRLRFVYPDMDSACARFRFRPEEPPVLPAIMRHLAEHSLRHKGDGYVWKFDASLMVGIDGESDDGVGMLGSVDAPIDFIAGELSRVVSAELANRICKSLTHGRGPIVIPSAHHHIPVNQPLALVSAIRALLA